MTLLVTFNGQFKPYRIDYESPSNFRTLKVKNANPIFKEVLTQYLGSELNKNNNENSSGLDNGKKFTTELYNKIQEHIRARVYARDLMHSPVYGLSSQNTLGNAIDFFSKHNCNHIPIVDDEVLVGIASDRSLLKALAFDKNIDGKLFEIMSPRVIVAQGHSSISEIARVMILENIHSLPIIDSKAHLIGIITSSDILHFVTTSFPVEFYG